MCLGASSPGPAARIFCVRSDAEKSALYGVCESLRARSTRACASFSETKLSEKTTLYWRIVRGQKPAKTGAGGGCTNLRVGKDIIVDAEPGASRQALLAEQQESKAKTAHDAVTYSGCSHEGKVCYRDASEHGLDLG